MCNMTVNGLNALSSVSGHLPPEFTGHPFMEGKSLTIVTPVELMSLTVTVRLTEPYCRNVYLLGQLLIQYLLCGRHKTPSDHQCLCIALYPSQSPSTCSYPHNDPEGLITYHYYVSDGKNVSRRQ